MVVDADKRKISVCISLDPDFVNLIDEKRGLVKRSPFINEILEQHFDKEDVSDV